MQIINYNFKIKRIWVLLDDNNQWRREGTVGSTCRTDDQKIF